MFEHAMHAVLPEIIAIIEIIGIIVVTVGCFKSFIQYVKFSVLGQDVAFVRHNLGLSMVTGLEFKMAAEILRTVLVRTKEEIFMLGGIIILRALLSFLIKKDISEGASSGRNNITGIHIDRE
ncbi:MAG: DUF1622 domain-containing protein [Oscillospiraceae bacterium]